LTIKIVEDPSPPSDLKAISAVVVSISIPLGIVALVVAIWGLFNRHLYDWLSGHPHGNVLGDAMTYFLSGVWALMGILFLAVGIHQRNPSKRHTL
jgi:hypothetical protein